MADRTIREEVPPLLERWRLLVKEDRAAHASWRFLEFVTMLAVSVSMYSYFSGKDAPPCLPYFWRGIASFAALQLELLIVLDYRNLAQQQVTRVAARRDPGLSVSYTLQLSSPELQHQYYLWMGRIPAVKWYPQVALAIQFVSFLRPLLGVENDACGSVSTAADVLSTVLMAARVVLDMGGAPKKVLSLFSIFTQAWINALNLGLVTSNDPCALSLGPSLGASLPTRAFFAAAVTTADLALMACTMEHLALQSLVVGLLLVPVQYILYLQQNGGISFDSDPCSCGFYTISFATLATLLVAVYIRYAFAKSQVLSFLNSNRAL